MESGDPIAKGIYGWSYGKNGVAYHRVLEPLRVLANHGHHTFYGPVMSDEILEQCDTIVAHMLHYPQDREVWSKIAKHGHHRMILDVDDWMWNPDWQPFRDAWGPDELDSLFECVYAAHVITTPSPAIAEHLSQYNKNVWVVPNTVPAYAREVAAEVMHASSEDHAWIVYQGSPSHVRDWQNKHVELALFLRENPLWGVGFIGAELGDFERFPSWRSDWFGNDQREDYYRTVARGVLGVGPLRNTAFNRAKSGLRAQEYAALGVVPVLPDMRIYRPYVEHGVTGILVGRRPGELRHALRSLASDPDRIAMMSAAAWQASARWTTEAAIGTWVEAWNSR